MFNKFVFICLISLLVITNQKNCREGTPIDKNDCFAREAPIGSHCCYTRPSLYYAFEEECREIEDYGEQREFIDKYGGRWLVECPDNIEYKIEKGNRCGLNEPTNPVDCWAYSTESKSCCYYNTTEKYTLPGKENQYIARCGWYKKKQGTIEDNDEFFDKAILSCFSLIYGVNFGLLFLIYGLFVL